MIPFKQIFHHDPANGVWGDCQRAALTKLAREKGVNLPMPGFD